MVFSVDPFLMIDHMFLPLCGGCSFCCCEAVQAAGAQPSCLEYNVALQVPIFRNWGEWFVNGDLGRCVNLALPFLLVECC